MYYVDLTKFENLLQRYNITASRAVKLNRENKVEYYTGFKTLKLPEKIEVDNGTTGDFEDDETGNAGNNTTTTPPKDYLTTLQGATQNLTLKDGKSYKCSTLKSLTASPVLTSQ